MIKLPHSFAGFGSRLRAFFVIVGALLTLSVGAPAALAHPLSQGTLHVTVYPDVVMVRARVTAEEVMITNMLAGLDERPTGSSAAKPGGMEGACRRHAEYLAQHIHVSADGRPLAGIVRSVQAPSSPAASDGDQAVYDLEFRVADPGTGPSPTLHSPTRSAAGFGGVELRHDVLVAPSGVSTAPWEATYVVAIGQADRTPQAGLLLTSRQPIQLTCDWSGASAADGKAAEAPRVDGWRLTREYLAHGVRHILTGYDHLLFVSALTLAAATVWDLLGLVTAFTIAHTLTLTLAATGHAHVPAAVVEPMIAGSIVVAAAQNLVWPRRGRRPWGLAVAFGFGLFHGLGFAGGLLVAMRELPPSAKLIAIAAFAVGVEAGHQLIIVPLFGGLRLARRTRPDAERREHFSAATRRYGSVAISLAGLFYLAVALRQTVFAAAAP